MTFLIIVGIIILILIFYHIGKKGGKNTSKSGVEFKVETTIDKSVDKDADKWEIVHRKTLRWKELGFDNEEQEHDKLFKREFEVWYCNVGSKEKNDLTELKAELALYKGDNLYYFERVYKQIDELKDVHLNFEQLSRANEYQKLYNVSFRKKRWYLGIKEMTPRYIFTAGAN